MMIVINCISAIADIINFSKNASNSSNLEEIELLITRLIAQNRGGLWQ